MNVDAHDQRDSQGWTSSLRHLQTTKNAVEHRRAQDATSMNTFMLLSSRADESAKVRLIRDINTGKTTRKRTQGGTMTDDGLIELAVVDDDVGITYRAGRDKVNGVAPEVRVREQLRPVPRSCILGRGSALDVVASRGYHAQYRKFAAPRWGERAQHRKQRLQRLAWRAN